MGWISAIFVHKALEAAAHLNCLSPETRADLSQSVGVDAEAPIDAEAMVSDSDFFGLLEQLLEEDDRSRSVPIVMGASMRCDDYGVFGLAFKSAPDLFGSYRRVERFGKVVTSIANFRVERSAGSVVMEVIPGKEQRPGLTMTNQLAVSAALAISREVSEGDFSPLTVHLMGDKPDNDEVFRAHFRCPIQYGATRDALEVDAEVAGRPNRLSDEGISRFFESHLNNELSAFDDHSVLERRILDHIGDALSEGVPALDDVADRLAMSSRTLQRRLSEAGLAYQDLVVQARRSLAEQLLKRTDYALAEIAFLTGFSDQSTFTRAFKRWHGQTPGSFRRGE